MDRRWAPISTSYHWREKLLKGITIMDMVITRKEWCQMSFGLQGFHGRVVECCGWDLRLEREVVFKLSFLFPRLLYMFYLSCVIHLNVNKREWYIVNWSKIHICVYMLYFFPLSCYKWEEYKSKSSWRKELNKIIELQASWDVYIIISFLFEQKVYSNLTKL